MTEIFLQTKGLTKRYPREDRFFRSGLQKRRAVDAVDLTVLRGETLAIVGESGCGKSTLGRMLLRLIPATEGEIWLKGERITHGTDERMLRKTMQIVFQDPYGSLNPWMTLYRLVAEPLKIHSICNKEEVASSVNMLLEKVGLGNIETDRYPHQLSGGQRQRLGIARALAVQPEFILCDEPVSALDVSIQSQILNLLADLQDEMGLTYVFISHSFAAVRSIADRVAVMYLGRIVEIAPADAFFSQPLHPYSIALIDSIPNPDPHQKRNPAPIGESFSQEPGAIGCVYAPRCPRHTERCQTESPVLINKGDGHSIACHHPA